MSLGRIVVFALLLVWCSDGAAAVNCDGEPSSTEGKLMKKLFCYNYDKTERPVKNHTSVINLTMTMHVQNYDVYENQMTLNLFVWMSLVWKDEFLNWDPTEYDMAKLVVDSGEIWRPTIIPFSNLDNGSPESACSSHKCEVTRTGDVSCIPPCDYKAICNSNTVDWPFDLLNCTVYLGTWVESLDKLRLKANSDVYTNDINVPNAEWKLLGADVEHFHRDNSTYPTLKYSFKLERHIAIYGIILTPGFVLIAINLAVLWMNHGNTERLYILCATCMGHFTYLEYLYWRVPYHGEQVPKMLIFFRDSLFINVLILGFTIILRHTRASAENSERFIDKLAFKVASTTMGRVLLQADGKPTQTSNANVGGNASESNADGDTVNLVVDNAPDTDRPPARVVTLVDTNATLVATFMDRLMFIGCTLCYAFMVCNLLPKETL